MNFFLSFGRKPQLQEGRIREHQKRTYNIKGNLENRHVSRTQKMTRLQRKPDLLELL